MCTNGRKADSLPVVIHKNRDGMSCKMLFIPCLKLEGKHSFTRQKKRKVRLDSTKCNFGYVPLQTWFRGSVIWRQLQDKCQNAGNVGSRSRPIRRFKKCRFFTRKYNLIDKRSIHAPEQIWQTSRDSNRGENKPPRRAEWVLFFLYLLHFSVPLQHLQTGPFSH